MFAVAILYAVVGHAGASGYLAVMGLFGTDAVIMKPIALTLNILAAAVGTYKFYRAGHFSWKLFWPFAVTSIPFAFLGGTLTLPTNIYKILVGLVLLYSAYWLFATAKSAEERPIVPPPLWAALLLGALSLSPGNYLNVNYADAVRSLDDVGKPVWCVAADDDPDSAATCRAATGDHYRVLVYPSGGHAMTFFRAGARLDPPVGQVILLFSWILPPKNAITSSRMFHSP